MTAEEQPATPQQPAHGAAGEPPEPVSPAERAEAVEPAEPVGEKLSDAVEDAITEAGDVAQAVETRGRRAFHQIIHDWIPLSIALVSILAAVMGWRASLADENSSHTRELARQDLVQQQQQLVQDNTAVQTDIRTFGQFAQQSQLAHSLLNDASQVGGHVGVQMLVDGQADLAAARYLGRQIVYQNYAFDLSNPTGNPALYADGTYQPGHPYSAASALTAAKNADPALHGLAPERLDQEAEHYATNAHDLEGIAALFICVLVLLTLAAIIPGSPRILLAGSGAAIAVAAVVLFSLVELA